MNLPYNAAIVLLGIYPRGMKADVHTKTCANVHSGFIWNSSKLGTTHIFFMGELNYGTSMSWNSTQKEMNYCYTKTWMDFKEIMLSEENRVFSVIPFM